MVLGSSTISRFVMVEGLALARRAAVLVACIVGVGGPVTAGAQTLPKWADPGSGSSGSEFGPPPNPPEEPPRDEPPVPIDGGLGLLLVAGGAYAAHRLRREA